MDKLSKNIFEPIDEALKQVEKFYEQKAQLDHAVGFTFTPDAWEQVKQTSKDAENIEHFRLYGLPCYVVPNQSQDCIAWFFKEALDAYLSGMTALQSVHAIQDIKTEVKEELKDNAENN